MPNPLISAFSNPASSKNEITACKGSAAIGKIIGAAKLKTVEINVAVIIILIITPTSLFSVGFQLSVCAAGGIIALSKNFAKPFKNKKLPKGSAAIGKIIGAAKLKTVEINVHKKRIIKITSNARYLSSWCFSIAPTIRNLAASSLNPSGFLPIQTVYSDFYIVKDLWPDFKEEHFDGALEWYGRQDVTLGG